MGSASQGSPPIEQGRLPTLSRGCRGGVPHHPPRFRLQHRPEDAFDPCGFRVVPGGPDAFIFRQKSGSSPSRRSRMNALSRTRCTRLLVAFGLCLMLAGPVMLLWASRVQLGNSPDGTGPDARMDQLEIDRMEHQLLPRATLRPEGFSPFGEAFKEG